MNGGALVLFSGYAAIFKIKPESVAVQLGIIALAFVCGASRGENVVVLHGPALLASVRVPP